MFKANPQWKGCTTQKVAMQRELFVSPCPFIILSKYSMRLATHTTKVAINELQG